MIVAFPGYIQLYLFIVVRLIYRDIKEVYLLKLYKMLQ